MLREWLSGVPYSGGWIDLSWVYEDPVSPLDFLWYGRWTNAHFGGIFARSKSANVNSVGSSFLDGADADADAGAAEWSVSDLIEPASSATGLKQLQDLSSLFAGFPGMGSNAFCWNKDYCQQTTAGSTVRYSGLMADPHDANFAAALANSSSFADQFLHLEPLGVHMWFAHVKVTPPGVSTPSLDAYGTIPHGMATFFTAHNQNVAWGGTLGAPNLSDAFLLRLAEDPQTGTNSGLDYYDYYLDTDGSNGGIGDNDWSSLTPHTCSIQRASGSPTLIPYWRAGPFGFVLPDMEQAAALVRSPAAPVPNLPVIYGEFPDSGSRHWRVEDNVPKMRYWSSPGAGRDPMVVTLRVPLDAAVDGEAFHWMFPRDAWEFAHANSVLDILLRLNEQAASYFVNFCCVDRTGQLLATVLGAIPMRGTYTIGGPPIPYGPGVHSFPELHRVYSGALGPVPARMSEDKVFDWRFSSYASGYPVPGTLRYLDLTGNGGATAYKAKFDFYAPGLSFPGWGEPPSGTPGPAWWTQNAGFASMCNATPWHASRKVAMAGATTGTQFNNAVTDNPVFQAVLDAGTSYQVSAFAWDSVDRNQKVIDRLTDIAKAYSADGAIRAQAKPPMTVDEVRTFAVDPVLHVADEYTTTPALAGLPPAIRLQQEILANLGIGGTSQASNGWPREEADREARFFHDLWDVLVNPTSGTTTAQQYWQSFRAPGTQSLNLSLKQIWVDNLVMGAASDTRLVMWYDTPTLANPGLRWIEMPEGFALIDFQWDLSEIGANGTVSFAGSGTSGFDAALVSEFQWLANWLANWGPASTPPEAKFRMDPASSAAGLYEMWRMTYTQQRKWVPLRDGQPVLANGQPMPHAMLWTWLKYSAFPLEQLQSANQTWASAEIPNDAYEALYSDTAQWTVRDGQSPLTSLTAEHLNHLTQFFLDLGGFFVQDFPITNNGNPSRKMARFKLTQARVAADPSLELRKEMLATYPGSYPLTANLARMTTSRRLIDAGRLMGGSAVIPTRSLSSYFGTRLCNHYGAVEYPAGRV